MKLLTETYRIRLSKDDKLLMKSLKRHGLKPTTFMRQAFREKIERDKPKILLSEQKRKEKEYCPF